MAISIKGRENEPCYVEFKVMENSHVNYWTNVAPSREYRRAGRLHQTLAGSGAVASNLLSQCQEPRAILTNREGDFKISIRNYSAVGVERLDSCVCFAFKTLAITLTFLSAQILVQLEQSIVDVIEKTFFICVLEIFSRGLITLYLNKDISNFYLPNILKNFTVLWRIVSGYHSLSWILFADIKCRLEALKNGSFLLLPLIGETTNPRWNLHFFNRK